MSLGLNRRWIVAVVVIVVAVLLLPMLWMGSWGGMMGAGMMGRGMMSYGGWGFGFSRMLVGALLCVGFVILILVGLYHLLSGEAKPSKVQVDGPLRILKERYARGEIAEDQFKKMRERARWRIESGAKTGKESKALCSRASSVRLGGSSLHHSAFR